MSAEDKNQEYSALIEAWRAGSDEARNKLLSILHDDLYKIGSILLKREAGGVSLFTGDLVNEAIGRLLKGSTLSINDRNHLLALSAKVMRNVLTDHARAKNTDKRRGQKITLTAVGSDLPANSVDLMTLDTVLHRLNAINPPDAELVEMRFYSGLSVAEIAGVLGVSASTINRRWAALRLWLKEAIHHENSLKRA